MPRYTPSTRVKVVPLEGEIEITLNINITVDGKVTAESENADVSVLSFAKEEEDKCPYIVPDFASGMKLNFGKQG